MMKEKLKDQINELKNTGQYRFLRDTCGRSGKYIETGGKKYLNLSSNDYLGLASDEDLRSAFLLEFQGNSNVSDYFCLSGSSSRLLTGNHHLYSELEQYLAKIYSREAALVFNSGYHANIGILPALFSKEDLILSDKLNHASMIDGIKLCGSDFYRYNHLDYEHLEKILRQKRSQYKNAVILSESVFSMDGDLADLKRLVEIKEKYDCVLYLDEAHACGVFGGNGLGLAETQNLIHQVDILIGTFGKAFASIGAYAVMDQIYREHLINFMRPLIFTTALAPMNLAWTLFLLKKTPDFAFRRKHLLELSSQLRNSFKEKGLKTAGESHIIPVFKGENEPALKNALKLQENGFLLFPIRPPTVPKGSSRIRISLMASLEWKDIDHLPELFL